MMDEKKTTDVSPLADLRSMRVIFIGMHSAFSLIPLERLAERCRVVGVVESMLKDAPPRRNSRIVAAAKHYGLLYHPLGFDDRGLTEFLSAARPDVLCVAGMARLLTAEDYSIPHLGAINLHPSLLPNYRGPDPFFWQARAMDLQGGVTIHQIEKQADTGDILAQAQFPIEAGEPYHSLCDRAAQLGAGLMIRVLEEMRTDQLKPQPQRHLHCRTIARTVARDDWEIDWTAWPIERVWHFLRAAPDQNLTLPPTPAAGRWSLGPMQLGAHAHAPGSLGQDEDGKFLSHPQGKIRVRFEPAPSIARRILNRLKRTVRR